MTVVLDSWAILAWLDGEEPALSEVDAIIADRPTVNWINLVEVYYRVQRDHGRDIADSTLADLRRTLDGDLPGTGRMLDAARIKADLPIALADCFAIATASSLGAELWTGDPEILNQPSLPCAVRDLRSTV
jgi:predicted nucleic acid-binding protein